MPERLLSVISGILAGGIPGFRFELCCFSPSYLAFFVFLCFLCFASHRWPLSNDTQDVIMHVFPIAGCDPTPLCSVRFVLVVVVCFLFVCVLLFWFGLFLMGLLTGLCIGPLPALLRLSTN